MACDVKEIGALTVIPVEKCNFTWKIENFSMCFLNPGEVLTSPEFTMESSYSTTWCLILYPNGRTKDKSDGMVGIYLERISTEVVAQFANFRLSIVASNQARILTRDFKYVFDKPDSCYGWHSFIDRKTLLSRSDWLTDDVLTVVCELKVSRLGSDVLTSESVEVVSASPFETTISNVSTLSDDLRKLYNNPEYSDFTLRVGDEEFQVHRNVLSARSPYFSRMLKQEMKEKISSSVDIVDYDARVIKKMLEYLYTAKMEDLTPEQAINVYLVAERYDLHDLKRLCAKFLKSHLSVCNICDVLLLADLHDDLDLMTAAKNFFCLHAASVQETEKWLDFSARKPDLTFSLNKAVILRSRRKHISVVDDEK